MHFSSFWLEYHQNTICLFTSQISPQIALMTPAFSGCYQKSFIFKPDTVQKETRMAESLYLLILKKDINTSAAHSYLRLSVILMQKANLHYTEVYIWSTTLLLKFTWHLDILLNGRKAVLQAKTVKCLLHNLCHNIVSNSTALSTPIQAWFIAANC